MASDDRYRTLLSDLGRATLRGVKKCPKCGTYNGSRGVCCKNKFCKAVFKESGEKKKLSADICRLVTGSKVSQVFSIRVNFRGPNNRGFVQLPVVNSTLSSDKSLQSSAFCFIENCEKNNEVSNCYQKNVSSLTPICSHIQAAEQCQTEAQTLLLRNSILSSMNLSNEIKQEIWNLVTETTGPLVQRVSKSIMAVKCKTSPKHPLGYVHFSFYTTKFKDKVHYKIVCSCSAETSNTTVDNRCVHFYACVWAFASDPKLSEEFQYFINLDSIDSSMQELDFQFGPNDPDIFVEMNLDSLTDDAHFLIFRDDSIVQNCDRLDINNLSLDPSILTSDVIESTKDDYHHLLEDPNIISELNISEVHNLEVIDQNLIFKSNGLKIIHNPVMIEPEFNGITDNHVLLDDNMRSINNSSMKILDPIGFDINNFKLLDPKTLTKGQNVNAKNNNVNTLERKINSIKRKHEENKNSSGIKNWSNSETKKIKNKSSQVAKKYQNESETVDESKVSLSFVKWLSSVTERINQAMHFQFSGKPEPLIFQIPQAFFDCLRERISCGSKKKRLPNSTTAFVRKDSVPLGTFTKYTWQITNILQIKSIFETPFLPLEITKSFIQKPDGTYEVYKREETEMDRFRNIGNGGTIKPMELQTFLKVGNTSPDQVQPTPFLIEWIPDILPISKIGELRIRFEFGHVTNDSSQKSKKVQLSKKNT